MKEVKKPTSRRNLDIAIDRLCTDLGEEPGRVKRLIAAVVVGQMLPDGAAKGGNALKIRFGKDVTRFSRDLDTARASSLNDYMTKLEDSLTIGWNGFSGAIVPREPASPKGIPTAYVMRPFEIKIAYNGKSWMTLPRSPAYAIATPRAALSSSYSLWLQWRSSAASTASRHRSRNTSAPSQKHSRAKAPDPSATHALSA